MTDNVDDTPPSCSRSTPNALVASITIFLTQLSARRPTSRCASNGTARMTTSALIASSMGCGTNDGPICLASEAIGRSSARDGHVDARAVECMGNGRTDPPKPNDCVAHKSPLLLDVGTEHATGNRTDMNPFRRLNLIECRASNLADATVAHQVRTRHVRALTGCKEHRRVGHLLGLSEPADRDHV